MKSSKTSSSRPAAKQKSVKPATAKFYSVEDYLASLPVQTKSIVKELRKVIRESIPQVEEKISYNIPAFTLHGKVLLWYAAWKEHISVYPRTAAMESSIQELKNYEGAKGTIKFPLDSPVPYSLMLKIARFRAGEISNKK